MEAISLVLMLGTRTLRLILAHPSCAHGVLSGKMVVLADICQTTLDVERKPWRFVGMTDQWMNWSIERSSVNTALTWVRLTNFDTGEVIERSFASHFSLVAQASSEGWSTACFDETWGDFMRAEREHAARVAAIREQQEMTPDPHEIDDLAEERGHIYGR